VYVLYVQIFVEKLALHNTGSEEITDIRTWYCHLQHVIIITSLN